MVDELRRHGVTLALVSPGSRSAALAIAFEEAAEIEVRIVLDERSAAFQAIGFARASGRPAVCVSTSGTAVANYLPAMVEADRSLVPLIAMTADRPPELRAVGANQTVDQVGMFGDRVRWFCDVGLADAGFDGNVYWRTLVSQAVARAMGHGRSPGPVHLNLSFREPTVPVSDDGRAAVEPYRHSIEGLPDGVPWQTSQVAKPVGAVLEQLNVSRGLVIAGEGIDDPVGLLAETRRLGWPVLATALSNMRGGPVVTSYHHLLVDDLPRAMMPEAVVSIGRIGPSDRLSALTSLDCSQIQIDRWGQWHDPRRHSDVLTQADPTATLGLTEGRPDLGWLELWSALDTRVRDVLDDRLDDGSDLTGPVIARSISEVGWGALSVASSMPVRDVDAHTVKGGRVFANRGASGIDGFTSTTLGIAGVHRRTLGLSGDLSFLHDVSALAGGYPGDVVLIVVDNNGGGLFDLLPPATHSPAFERLFVAPHDKDLVAVASAFGVGAMTIESRQQLTEETESRLSEGGVHVLVVPVDREVELKQRRELDEAAAMAMSSLS